MFGRILKHVTVYERRSGAFIVNFEDSSHLFLVN